MEVSIFEGKSEVMNRKSSLSKFELMKRATRELGQVANYDSDASGSFDEEDEEVHF